MPLDVTKSMSENFECIKKIKFIIGHEQRMRHAGRERLPYKTPGFFPFLGLAYDLIVENTSSYPISCYNHPSATENKAIREGVGDGGKKPPSYNIANLRINFFNVTKIPFCGNQLCFLDFFSSNTTRYFLDCLHQLFSRSSNKQCDKSNI